MVASLSSCYGLMRLYNDLTSYEDWLEAMPGENNANPHLQV